MESKLSTIDFIISNRLHDLNSSLKTLPPLPLLVDNLWKNSRTRRGIFCFGCFINLWIANFVLTSVNKNYSKLTPWPENTEQLFHKPKLKWKGQPRTPPSPLYGTVSSSCRGRAPHWVGDSVWRMIEVPACAEHFKYLQRYFKKRSWHVLLLLPPCPSPSPTLLLPTLVCHRVQAFAFCRMFCSFFGRAAEREVQLQIAAWGLPCCGQWGWRVAKEEGRSTVNGLRHLSACVLLGKCQKPLVKKPYGNYSTQLNMKCGKGSAVSPGMRFDGGTGGREGSEKRGCRMKKVAALGK